MAEPLQLKRTTKGTLVDGEPFLDKTNKRLLLQADSNELQFVPLRNSLYVFKHVPITGNLTTPNLIEVIPASGLDVDSSTTITEGWTGNSRTIEPFEAAANYSALGYSIEIIPEQAEQVVNLYSSFYPKVQDGKLVFKLGRSGIGEGYNETTSCYCTVIIRKLF